MNFIIHSSLFILHFLQIFIASDPSAQVLLRIRPALPDPEDPASKHGPLLIEPAIAALQSLRGKASIVSFEIGSYQNKICFFVRADASARSLIESQLYAQYPAIDIEEMDPKELEPASGQSVSSVDLRLSRPEIYPIKRHPQFDDILSRQNVDTLAGITSTLVRYPQPGMRGHIQVVFCPLKSSFRRRVIKFLPLLEKGFSKRFQWYAHLFARVHLSRGWRWWVLLPLNIVMGGFRAWFSFMPSLSDATLSPDLELAEDLSEERLKNSRRSHENEDPFSAAADKANRLLFLCNVRVTVIGKSDRQDLAAQKLGEIVSSFRQFALPDCNSFRIGTSHTASTLPVGFSRQPYMFSVEELATLWHFPNALVKTPNIDWVQFKKLEPPVDLPLAPVDGAAESDVTVLGEAVFRGHRAAFGIRPDDRRRHMYIIGKTGMGKSTLLENMIYSDIISGKVSVSSIRTVI